MMLCDEQMARKAQAHEKASKEWDKKKTRKYSVYLYVWYTFNVFRLYCAYICICHMLMLILYYSETTVSLFFHRLEKEKNLLNIYIYIYISAILYEKNIGIHLELSCQSVCVPKYALSLKRILDSFVFIFKNLEFSRFNCCVTLLQTP